MISTTFETRPFARPLLALRALGIQDANGNGVVERGEQIEIKAQVANTGGGLAHQVAARLVIGNAKIMATGDEQLALGDIPPGTTKDVQFSVLVLNRYDGEKALPISVALTEAHPQFGATEPLKLILDQAGPTTIAQVVETKELPTLAGDGQDDLAFKGTPARPNPNAYALVIGIERYGAQLPEATFARRDAAAFRRFCEQVVGIPAENTITLTDEKATGGNIRTALEGQLPRWVDRGKSDLFVYFAGHGAPDVASHGSYLVPFDGNPSYPATSCYAVAAAYDDLAKLGARSVTVVLDSCFSGQSNRSTQAKPLLGSLRPLFIEPVDQAVPAGLTVLAAANGAQTSSGLPTKMHGLFTYYLLKGLEGEADTNHDRKVTVGELKAYLLASVPREARRQNLEQTPTVSGPDDRVLVALP